MNIGCLLCHYLLEPKILAFCWLWCNHKDSWVRDGVMTSQHAWKWWIVLVRVKMKQTHDSHEQDQDDLVLNVLVLLCFSFIIWFPFGILALLGARKCEFCWIFFYDIFCVFKCIWKEIKKKYYATGSGF